MAQAFDILSQKQIRFWLSAPVPLTASAVIPILRHWCLAIWRNWATANPWLISQHLFIRNGSWTPRQTSDRPGFALVQRPPGSILEVRSQSNSRKCRTGILTKQMLGGVDVLKVWDAGPTANCPRLEMGAQVGDKTWQLVRRLRPCYVWNQTFPDECSHGRRKLRRNIET
jgi:hypothetical protein